MHGEPLVTRRKKCFYEMKIDRDIRDRETVRAAMEMHSPGTIIKTSDGKLYRVHKDGSRRRFVSEEDVKRLVKRLR